jgi:predicted DNA-binding transcriptional regulator AlpA
MAVALRPESPMRAEQVYSAEEVAKLLSVSRATFYRLAWFKARKVRTSVGTVGYLASDVALYQSLRRGI